MAKETAPKPRATGPHGNGARPLELDSLAAVGLVAVRVLVTTPEVVKGRFTAPVELHETVVPVDELPKWVNAAGPKLRRCNACRGADFRARPGNDGWVCARCHPEVTA